MQRGNLVLYDTVGTIVLQTGEAEGEILPHVYPVGIQYIELKYGDMKYDEQTLVKIDVSVEPHKPVFEVITRERTDAEKLAMYEKRLRKAGLL